MTIPTVNINGTSSKELVEGRLNAASACLVLMQTLHQTMPHLRDYPGTSDAYRAARKVYDDRIRVIDAMRNQLLDECGLILQQEEN